MSVRPVKVSSLPNRSNTLPEFQSNPRHTVKMAAAIMAIESIARASKRKARYVTLTGSSSSTAAPPVADPDKTIRAQQPANSTLNSI